MNNDCIWYNNVCELANTEDCNNICIRYMEMRRLCELSNLPKEKWRVPQLFCYADDKTAFKNLTDIKNDVDNFVKSGSNLYLYSENTGNGKTSWAIRLMLSYFNKIWSGNGFRCRGVFISVPNFLFMHKEIINNFDADFANLKNAVLNADLVIWDDIGVSPLTAYEHQLLLTYIDSRLLKSQANIYTGNVDVTTLEKYLGTRLASRIWNTSNHIHLVEPDKRNSLIRGVK